MYRVVTPLETDYLVDNEWWLDEGRPFNAYKKEESDESEESTEHNN